MSVNPFSNPTFLALNREAELSVRLICDGVNALRKASRAPDTYSALFSITMGLERLGKLCFLLDRFFKGKGEFPTDKELRNVGHDIDALSKEIVRIATDRNMEKPELFILHENVSESIIACLSEFARGARYYNLDTLVGSRKTAPKDPIVRWREDVGQPVLDKHYPQWRREKDTTLAQSLGGVLDTVSFTMGVSQSNSPIDSQVQAIAISKGANYLKKWVPFYILRIVRVFARVVIELSYETYKRHDLSPVPHMIDHFGRFLNDDDFLKNHSVCS